MTQNEKDLLYKDLCARLPYGVRIHTYCLFDQDSVDPLYSLREYKGEIRINDVYYINEVKPYLFPLSTMTDEQCKELEEIDPEFYSLICENGDICVSMDVRGYDWLNKNHLDYRGLIGRGLALDASGLNIY